MKLKDISRKEYKRIKEANGNEYATFYNEALLLKNGLTSTELYKKLVQYPKLDGYYVLGLIDFKGNWIQSGWTSLSLLDYWTNYLKKVDDITVLTDIIILKTVFDKKEAIRKSNELKGDYLKLSRKHKLRNLLD